MLYGLEKQILLQRLDSFVPYLLFLAEQNYLNYSYLNSFYILTPFPTLKWALAGVGRLEFLDPVPYPKQKLIKNYKQRCVKHGKDNNFHY